MHSRKKQVETWTIKGPFGEENFNVEVTHGKQVDILSLKASQVADFKSHVSKIRDSRITMYGKKNLRRMDTCPICGSPVKDTNSTRAIYGAEYYQCHHCFHCFVLNQPNEKDFCEFYERDENYQATWADDQTSHIRIEQVATPKARWLVRQFERVYGRKPKSILDVGAGSGHFVRACSDMGIPTSGIEPSKPGRDYARDRFGLDLSDRDFIREWEHFKDYEVVTFWGVIEHVPHPMEMLSAASKILSDKEGMVLAEVPRYGSMSTLVQTLFPDSIVRHLDPLGHINCFTDSSLATAFWLSDFRVTAAWYFGMDAYELIMQLSLLLNRDDFVSAMKNHIPDIQKAVDLAKMSDEIVVTGVPLHSN
jgi:SAM-dependent methyltransferase